MPRNVEIKARVKDLELVKRRILDLTSTTNDTDGVSFVRHQEDTFFNLPAGNGGKLKMRKVEGIPPELIYYEREENTGPSLSKYSKCSVPENLNEFLINALGTWGIVKKVRTLIMIDQTRVHFDSVEGLGDFVELEVVLKESQMVEDGEKIAAALVSHMGIEEKDLISVSYVNMLCEKK